MTQTAIVRRSDIVEIQREIDCDKIGHIYFITNPEAETVKIGYATDTNRRLESLQTGNHVKLLMYSAFPGSVQVERIIHRAVKEFKIINEWFHHTSKLDQLISCFEDQLFERDDYETPLSPSEVEFVIDDWMNSYGRGRSAAALSVLE